MSIRCLAAWIGCAVLLLGITPPRTARADGDEYGKLKINGDIRGRYEGFRFATDEMTGEKKEARSRLRYRFRLNAGTQINPHIGVAARLTTGDSDNRSGNQTLGSPEDFAPSEFDLRRAYIAIYPFKDGSLGGSPEGAWKFAFGRVPNPFLWKNGPDNRVWDSDIALAGLSTAASMMAWEAVTLFAATGYYTISESSSSQDPFLLPFQAGLVANTSESVSLGARGTFYFYDRLDEKYIERAAEFGNIPDGLTGDPTGGTLQVVEGQAFVRVTGNEKWPVTIFGGAGYNTSAAVSDAVPAAGKAANAYNVGIEVGDKKKSVRLGLAALHIEANGLAAQFIDSDYLDGVTNRKGLVGYLQRQILKGTEFATTLFYSDVIDADAILPDRESLRIGSERFRIQVDLSAKF